MKTILKVIVVLACLNLSSSFLKAQEATKPVKNDGRKIIAIDEVIEDSFGPDTPKTRGWNMNKYRFAGKKGEPLTIMIESDFAEGDNSRIYVWLSRDEGIDVQLGGNYERRKAAATWSTILQKDGEYLLNAYPMKREFQGKYRFVIARGGKDQAAALLNGGAPSALSASAGAAAGTATVAGTATAVTGRSNEFKEGIPAFPKMPEHPDLPEATAAFKLYSDFTSSSWTANSKLQSPGTLEKNFKVKGSFFCESASGSAEVTFGVDKSKPAVAQIRLMRLQDSTCGKPVQAFIVYANGDFWLGTVKLEKGYLTPQAVDGLLARSNGEAAYGTMLNDGRLKVAFLTDPNGVALKRLDPNIPLDGIAPYRLIIPLVGQVDGEANNLNLVPLTAGSFKTFDGTYKTSGPISVFEVNGSNAQRAQETAILFRFTNGEPAKHPVLAMRLEGLTRIETTQATGLGPAGVYLFHGVLKPGLLPLAEEVQPAPGTLAKYATDSEACAMKPAIPVSWLLWAPECKAKPDTMQAWSVDGRYRLTFKKLGQTVLEMFDPSRPGQPLAEWRAASFTTDKVPAPKGPTEMWRDDALAFKGPFQGLQPNGAGLCGIPGEENKTEKCVYENGERVDAIYLARLEQAKLDAEFAQRISESENNRRAAAEQRAQRAREAAEQKRQVELAQARERQQKKSALFGALLGAGLQSMASTSALNSYSSGSSFQNPLQTLVDTTMQQTMGTNLTTMATDPARATMQIVQHGVEESARKAQQNAATSQAAIAPVTQPQSTSAAAFSAPARGSAAAPSSNLIDGTYATADTAYQIEVKLSGNTLTVIEPNKTSQYTQTGLGRFEFRNPTNGILYGLQIVNNKTLMAFKPPANPSTGTQLNLIRAAAQSSGGACKAESLTVAGQKIYGLRELIDPQHGKVKVDGHYRYIDHASGMPDIMLTNGSGSYFNAHGAGPGTGERHDIKNWWIQANCDGTPINEGKTDVGVKYVLIFEYTSPYQGNIFDLAQLGISWTQQKMYIFGERAKGLSE
jgi:hypothetical protein